MDNKQNGFPLTDDQLEKLTGWIQLVQMQDDCVSVTDTEKAIRDIVEETN